VVRTVPLKLRGYVRRPDEGVEPEETTGFIEEQGVQAVTILEQNLPENEALANRDVKRVGKPVQPAQRTPLGKLLDLEDGSVVHCDCGDPADFAHLRCRRLRVGPDRRERPYGRG